MAIVLVLVVTAGTAAAVVDVTAAPSAGIATASANAHLTRLATASPPTVPGPPLGDVCRDHIARGDPIHTGDVALTRAGASLFDLC